MPLVQTVNLTKTYGQGPTAVVALDHVNISVDAGELVAVMGPSGCGKSTLLHLLGGLDRPTEGSVMIDGKSLSSLSDNALAQMRRRKIGFIFQFFNLIPILDAVDNAALPLLLDGKNGQAKQKATEWRSGGPGRAPAQSAGRALRGPAAARAIAGAAHRPDARARGRADRQPGFAQRTKSQACCARWRRSGPCGAHGDA